MFWNKYPYTDFHELNLDWILEEVKKLGAEMKDFEAINKITFSGAWDITDQYPAWTIVSDNNIGYISIKPVPAGVPLTNTDYWRAVIDYTTQIADLQNRVVNLESDVSDIQTLLQDRTELLLFGDSWADWEHDQNNVMIPQTLERALELNVHNYSYGGTGFDVTNGYNDQLDWYIADTSFDHNKVKYVVLVAGLNEYHAGTTSADFATKLDAWVTRVKAVVPKWVKIYWFHNYSIENDPTRPIPSYFYNQRNYYRNIFGYSQTDVIAVHTFGWVDAANWNTNNYFHPNAIGSVQYADNMVRTINGVEPQTYMYDKHTGTANTSAVADGLKSCPVFFFVQGDELFAVPRPTMALLGNCATNTHIEFTGRRLPANLNTGQHIEQGMTFENNDPTYLNLYIMNSDSRNWSSSGGGRCVYQYFSCTAWT